MIHDEKENVSSNTSPTRTSVHYGLAREAEWAASILEFLTQPAESQETKRKVVVPRIAIARAKGLAFFEQNKYGAVFSVTKSRGFLVRNLGWQDGQPQWSAPLFMDMTTGGLGLSLGYETLMSCIVLNTEEAVDDFAQGKPVVSLDTKVLMSAQPVQAGEEMQLGDELDDEEEVTVYSVASGRMLDVSLQGGSMAPSYDNQRYYGKDTSAEQVLSGQVPAPKEFGSIYSNLSSLAEQGSAMVSKLQHAGVRMFDSTRAPAGWRSTY